MGKKTKEIIRLRQRKMPSGNTSLYLDIYIKGKRTYEYLSLYLVPEVTRADKAKNKETLQFAESIKAKRIVELQNGIFGFNNSSKLKTNFLDYFEQLANQRRSRGNQTIWRSALNHLRIYCKPNTTFADVDAAWIRGFKGYLNDAKCLSRKSVRASTHEKPLSQGSKGLYFDKLRACINQAFADGIIPQNPLKNIEGFKHDEIERVYLTLDEVRAMASTQCRYPVLYDAFLFSCLTGIRRVDIMKMTWREVKQEGDNVRIIFTQQKTKGLEYLDISQQAAKYLGERRADDEKVFAGLDFSSYIFVELRQWAMRAGVKKDVTFHTARHTFAVLMLTLGTDIYTVQKLLGHREIQTTQIYAKVVDSKKKEAVNRIPDLSQSLNRSNISEIDSDN